MKVGDLIKEIGLPEVGLIVRINTHRVAPGRLTYAVLCPSGKIEQFSDKYVEEKCEVVSESR